MNTASGKENNSTNVILQRSMNTASGKENNSTNIILQESWTLLVAKKISLF
jgi:hypothetical protein